MSKYRLFNCKITRIKVKQFITLRDKVYFRQDYKRYWKTMNYTIIRTDLDNIN